jgi:asparagine synthase (glutamine-hydrolysing)
MQVGFSVIARHQDVQFEIFGPCSSARPSLVVFFETTDYAAILMGRLYYRRELLADLGSDLPEDLAQPCESNDAALALAAYRRWGLKGLERLEGDVALVIWDAREKRLVGSRDPMGGYPLFWMKRDGTIAVSTGLQPLLDRLPQRILALDYLAEFLMIPGPVNERASERCAYEGIHRLCPGSLLSVETDRGNIEQHVYWHWLERVVDPGTDRLEEIGQQYADLLQHAVRERIHGPTACHLSGGMDSTAVSLIARDWIAAGVGEVPLHTISLVYEKLGGLARETPYLEAALRDQTAIVAHRIPADDLLDFDSFASPPPHDEPYVGLWRLGMDRATMEAAAKCGVTTILTGLGADELLDVQPFHLTELLRRGHLCAAWREACRWAQVDNCSPWKILAPFGLANLFPAWTRGGVGRALLPRALGSWKTQHDWAIAPWIVPSFVRRHALHSRAIENAHRTYRLCPSTALSFILSSIESRTGDVIRWSLAAPQGMCTAHPFLDSRIFEL